MSDLILFNKLLYFTAGLLLQEILWRNNQVSNFKVTIARFHGGSLNVLSVEPIYRFP